MYWKNIFYHIINHKQPLQVKAKGNIEDLLPPTVPDYREIKFLLGKEEWETNEWEKLVPGQMGNKQINN